MNLLLYTRAIIVSNLTETEIIKRLSEILECKKKGAFSYPDQTKKYTGKIENRYFKISKIIKGRNSFIPFIQGKISDNISTRKIELTMRLHSVVIFFLLLFFGFILNALKNLNEYSILVFTIGVFGITIFFFNQDCNKALKDLKDIFIA